MESSSGDDALFQKFSKILQISEEVDIKFVAKSLGMSEIDLFELLVEWGTRIPFRIKKNSIIKGNKEPKPGTSIKSDPATIKATERFCDKSQMIAVEANKIFNKKREICQIIGIILIHQAVELALKALANQKGLDLYEKGTNTITFCDALAISDCTKEQKNNLKRLDGIRNALVHDAIVVPSFSFVPSIFQAALEIITHIFDELKQPHDELDIIISPAKLEMIENEIETEIGAETNGD